VNAVCKRLYYSGRVQGVGFRYTARQLAQGYAVAGHVRNLDDGRVEVLVEGAADQVEAFLAALGRQLAGYIENVTSQHESPLGGRAFVIRH
jgi:acylphosphatase